VQDEDQSTAALYKTGFLNPHYKLITNKTDNKINKVPKKIPNKNN
jgi:hypothetical protein